jgi:type II secretory pathway component PulM
MNFFNKLQRREKIFVVGAGVVVLVTLLFLLVIDPLLKHSAALDRQIVAAERQVKELHTLQRDYLRQRAVVDRINTQLKQQRKNFQIISRLTELADQVGVGSNISEMKPTLSTPSNAYNEESVEIKMAGVTLEQLVRYLYQIESSRELVKVKRLFINPRRDNRQLLAATFRVSVFSLKE